MWDQCARSLRSSLMAGSVANGVRGCVYEVMETAGAGEVDPPSVSVLPRSARKRARTRRIKNSSSGTFEGGLLSGERRQFVR
jgi:hypothetical protein